MSFVSPGWRPGLHSVAAARLIRGIDRGCCSSGKEREGMGTHCGNREQGPRAVARRGVNGEVNCSWDQRTFRVNSTGWEMLPLVAVTVML
jgi:hypothetical protein